jgi:vitamin B12 transporter
MHKSLYSSAALIALIAPALAQTAPETVVVTATRTPQPLDVTGESVSVVTDTDLDTQQIDIASNALKELPGVTIVRDGGPGQTTDVLIRGSEAGQTVALIDGVRINDPSATTGEAVYGDLMVNNIQRIEVLSGPQSTLYGSDAIGGVIDIITKRGGDTPFAFNAEAEGGEFDTARVNLAVNGTEGAVEYGAAANYYGTNGVSAADARNGNTEADGTHNLGATANVRVHAGDTVSFDARLYYTQARDSFDGYPPPNYTFEDDHEFGRDVLLTGYLGANVSLLGGKFGNRLALLYTDSDREDFDPTQTPEEDFYAKGRATRFEYQGTFEADAANEITFGAESETTTLNTESSGDPAPTLGSDRISGGYVQWQTQPIDALTLTGGARYDDDKEFGGHTSLKFAAAYQATATTTLRADYGDGFKAPSLYDLFSQYSNPLAALKPETAKGWEAGADQALWSGARVSLTYFWRHTKNQIDFFDCYGVTSTACDLRAFQGGYYYNIDRSRASGVEAGFADQLSDTLSLKADYTYLSAVDADTGLQLSRRPHDSANLTANWQVCPDFSTGLNLNYVGSRFDDNAHTTPLKAATELNLFASYKIDAHWELFGRVENLANNLEEPVAGYGTPGRAFYAGIRVGM